jgi:branched-chain amino acid transport system ATP-binding protein
MNSGQILTVANLDAHYGAAQALFDVSFDVVEREKLAIVGINGMGKSTLASVLAGWITPTRGSITFYDEDITSQPANAVASRGIALVPQGRRVFSSLTVDENLRVAARGRGSVGSVEDAYEVFPVLEAMRNRWATSLSGGEQQMLAIGRALVRGPRLLILDEPTEGLAPIVIDQLTVALKRLADASMSLVLFEQRRAFAEGVCDRVLEMSQRGSVESER